MTNNKNYCEKHHLSFGGARCPICEREMFSGKYRKPTKVIIGTASRELYAEEYAIKPEPDYEKLLREKFGNVSKL